MTSSVKKKPDNIGVTSFAICNILNLLWMLSTVFKTLFIELLYSHDCNLFNNRLPTMRSINIYILCFKLILNVHQISNVSKDTLLIKKTSEQKIGESNIFKFTHESIEYTF